MRRVALSLFVLLLASQAFAQCTECNGNTCGLSQAAAEDLAGAASTMADDAYSEISDLDNARLNDFADRDYYAVMDQYDDCAANVDDDHEDEGTPHLSTTDENLINGWNDMLLADYDDVKSAESDAHDIYQGTPLQQPEMVTLADEVGQHVDDGEYCSAKEDHDAVEGMYEDILLLVADGWNYLDDCYSWLDAIDSRMSIRCYLYTPY